MNENGSQMYIDEWKRLFGDPQYLPIIRHKAFAGGLRSCRFRSICWKISLNCLPLNVEAWGDVSDEKRQHFQVIKNELMIDPNAVDLKSSADPNIENPLSQNTESIWRRYHEDEELRLIITQDVIRTFPEIQYFHLPEVRELMINILFIFARQNPSISYRQGMHELLAPIIFVLHSDQQSFLHAAEIHCLDLVENPDKEVLPKVLDCQFLEHDAYSMFSELMKHMELWYTIRDRTPKRLERIHSSLLCRFDNDLYVHLTKLEISPQIYGIRWLRLLFGREFPIQDLLVIWDAVIVDNRDFQLIEYIFIAMLISIRHKLLCDDYATCLGYLMRFPPASDVHFIIDMGLHLREPYKFERPSLSSHHMVNHVVTVGGRPNVNRMPFSERKGSKWKAPEKDSHNYGVLSSFSSMMSSLSRTFDGISAPNNVAPVSRSTNDTSKTLPSPTLDEVGIDASQIINKELKPLPGSSKPSDSGEMDPNAVNAEADGDKEVPKRRVRPNSLTTKINIIESLQERLDNDDNVRKYCADNMSIHIDLIQECISKQPLETGDQIMVSLAFLKRIRDILKGTLNFSQASEDNLLNDHIQH